MTQFRFDHFPIVPEHFGSEQEQRRKLAQAINGLLRGQANNTAEVTLAPNATETLVETEKIVESTVLVLTPRSASAAAAQAILWVETTKGSATLHHDSSPATDRTFGIVLHN
jgi:hypothetical protein